MRAAKIAAARRGLPRSWARFGDLERSRQWLEKARMSGEDVTGFSVPSRSPLTEGAVSGRVMMPRGSAQAVAAGLFALNNGAKSCSAPRLPSKALHTLASSQWLKRDGSFRFENISEGRYCLSLLASSSVIPSDGKGVSVSRNPDIITLDRAHPRAELGAIALNVP